MSKEIWKSIPGFDGYEVSNQGRVRSFKKSIGLGAGKGSMSIIADEPQRILSPRHRKGGYLAVGLCANGKVCDFYIHALVMLAFIGPYPNGLEICHSDDDPTNNNLENLRYDTHANNMRGVLGKRYSPRTADSRILANIDIKYIRELVESDHNTSEIKKKFGISKKYINQIVYGETHIEAGGPIKKSRSIRSLSDTIVQQIREARQCGLLLIDIAYKFNIDQSTVSLLARGHRRKGAGGPIEGIDYSLDK